jgi:hypothetical protein
MKPLINVWNSGISLLMLNREQRLQPMKTKASQNAHRGSDFRDFLAGEGILPELEVLALKRVVSLQHQQILDHEQVV